MIHFGLSLQDNFLPLPSHATIEDHWFGPKALLAYLERHLGLGISDEDRDYLRPEQYRQALRQYLKEKPTAFFAASFAADDLGTAATLLSWRDELLAVGWKFEASATTHRLMALATVEHWLNNREFGLQLYPGMADRMDQIGQAAERVPSFMPVLQLCDEWQWLPPAWQRLLEQLISAGVQLKDYQPPQDFADTDLGTWQAYLSGQAKQRPSLRGDGSLLLMRAFRETHQAAYLAKIVHKNDAFRPAIFLPKANRTLDNAFLLEGLPSMGVPSTSLARPSLQVLKLAPVFLWQPYDLNKIMEFVSLAVKPLDEGIAQKIASFLADTPGLYSDRWFGMLKTYFEVDLPKLAEKRPQLDPDQIRSEFNFWFARKRYDSRSERVPKGDVRQIYQRLFLWARGTNGDTESSMLVLASQCQKIVDLLDTLPEEDLSYLELERVVRAIYEPAPVQYQVAEAGHLVTVFRPGAIIGPVNELVCWDFIQQDRDYFFSHWYPDELAALAANGVQIEQPAVQNQRQAVQRKRPVLWTQKRLILCLPDYSNGQATSPHALLGDLEAAFGDDLSPIELHIDQQKVGEAWRKSLLLPELTAITTTPLPKPQPQIKLKKAIATREEETPTNIERLLYYPYQWVFRQHSKLRASSLLTVLEDARLFGNLGHRLLENLLSNAFESWDQGEVNRWVQTEIPKLLSKEGAPLLLYGREPEQIAFTKYMKYAAWSLISLIKNNGWSVVGSEEELTGPWLHQQLRGRADLVLQRGTEYAIIDLKWRGATRYTNLLHSREDIQLALYANMLKQEQPIWPHTAYFIIEKGKLLSRNSQAFREIQAVQDETDHQEVYKELLARIEHTYRWRLSQLQGGLIEIRCQQTADDLEDIYGAELLDLLEMKNGNAAFEDYGVLIGLVN